MILKDYGDCKFYELNGDMDAVEIENKLRDIFKNKIVGGGVNGKERCNEDKRAS